MVEQVREVCLCAAMFLLVLVPILMIVVPGIGALLEILANRKSKQKWPTFQAVKLTEPWPKGANVADSEKGQFQPGESPLFRGE